MIKEIFGSEEVLLWIEVMFNIMVIILWWVCIFFLNRERGGCKCLMFLLIEI